MLKTKASHKPTIINGINVDDVKALIADVAAQPEAGATHWKVATEWQGQTATRATVTGFGLGADHIARDFTIDIDEPVELGGANAHANPQEYLIAALNACMTVGYVAQCSLRGIAIEKLEIETEGEIDLRGFLGLDAKVAPGYRSLRYTVRIKGDASDEEFREVHAAVMATSPNFYNLSRPVALDADLVVE